MDPKNWYHKEGRAPHFQGHVIDEATGADIAVTYNDEGGEHARLIATAPRLLAFAQMIANGGMSAADEATIEREAWALIHEATTT